PSQAPSFCIPESAQRLANGRPNRGSFTSVGGVAPLLFSVGDLPRFDQLAVARPRCERILFEGISLEIVEQSLAAVPDELPSTEADPLPRLAHPAEVDRAFVGSGRSRERRREISSLRPVDRRSDEQAEERGSDVDQAHRRRDANTRRDPGSAKYPWHPELLLPSTEAVTLHPVLEERLAVIRHE